MSDALAAEDDRENHWENFGESAERNPAQAYRRRMVLPRPAEVGGPQRYLDIGSGQGNLAAWVAERWPAAEIAGSELSAKGVHIAVGKVPWGRFEEFDLLSGQPPLAGLAGWATHATCSDVFEHVDEPQPFLTAARQWLAPGPRWW